MFIKFLNTFFKRFLITRDQRNRNSTGNSKGGCIPRAFPLLFLVRLGLLEGELESCRNLGAVALSIGFLIIKLSLELHEIDKIHMLPVTRVLECHRFNGLFINPQLKVVIILQYSKIMINVSWPMALWQGDTISGTILTSY